MNEIKIYGEIVPFQDAWVIEQGGYCNLTDVQNQLKEANGNDVRVRINSFGGDVDEGFAIYSELRRYAKEHNAQITTLAEGRCASIATIIFLAGDKRITTEYTEPFVHNAWTYTMGDAKQILRVAQELEACNDKIAKHYETHTNLTYEEARLLMDNETFITANECLALRFATEIEEVLRPVALKKVLNRNSNKNQTAMAKKPNSLKAMIGKLLGFQNKIVKTADEKEVDFYELEDNDKEMVGDKATIDGNPAEGEIVMASGETYVFSNGELTEIKPVDEGGEDEETDVEALTEDVEEIKEALATLIETVAPELQNLRNENKRMAKALNKLQGVDAEEPSQKHDKAKEKDKKNSINVDSVGSVKLKK